MASQPVQGAPAAPFDISQVLPPPVDYTALLRAARGQANADVATNVSGIRAQQTQLLQEAAQRAAQQQALGLSASRYLASLNLPGLTEQAFSHSADAERAAAQGYSGGLQQTVSDQAAQVQAHLDRLGSPQTAVNPGAAAGNVLYGLGGNLPASQLDLAGPLTAATLRALPSQSLAYGQEQATAALGQGQREAAKLQPDILAAQAQRSTLTANYLKTLADQARQAGNDRFAHVLDVLKYQADQSAAQATAQYRADQIAGENARANASIAAADRRSQATIAAEGRRNAATIAGEDRRAASAATAAAAKPYRYQGANGAEYQINPDGTFTRLPGGTKAASGSLSASGKATGARMLGDDVGKWASGDSPQYHYVSGGDPQLAAGTPGSAWQPVPGTGNAATPYPQAMAQALSQYPGLSPKVVRGIVNSHYPPGTNGRYFSGREARAEAEAGAKFALAHGQTYEQALATGRAALIPDSALIPALQRAYHPAPLSPPPSWLQVRPAAHATARVVTGSGLPPLSGSPVVPGYTPPPLLGG